MKRDPIAVWTGNDWTRADLTHSSAYIGDWVDGANKRLAELRPLLDAAELLAACLEAYVEQDDGSELGLSAVGALTFYARTKGDAA